MVSSNIEEIIDIARQFAWWGRDCYCVGSCNTLMNGTCGKRFDKWLDGYDGIVDHKYVFSQIGYNLKPLDLQGAIGQVQLKKFDEIHELRRANYGYIQRCFDDYPIDVRVIEEADSAMTSWFGVPIVCNNSKIKHGLQQHLEQSGIQTRNYFAGNLLLHPAYKALGNAKDYPRAMEVLNKVFFLGTAPTLSTEDLEFVREKLIEFRDNQPIKCDGYSCMFDVK